MSMLDHPDRFIPSREDEREFLLQRAVFGDSTWVGVSSDHMLWHALNKKRGLPDWFPMDAWDLGRCEETYRRAPEHLRRRMLRVLKVFRQAVAEGGLFCHGCRTGGHNSTRRNLCRDCQRTSGPQAPIPSPSIPVSGCGEIAQDGDTEETT